MMMTNRLPQEDFDTYALRLYENKSQYGLNSESIAELLNKESGLSKTESAFRKFYTAFRKGRDYAISKNCSVSDIDDKIKELESEKIKFQTIKNEYRTLVRKDARHELFYENIGKIINTLPVPKFEKRAELNITNKAHVLTIADIHCGSDFNFDKNKYDYQECARRFNILESETIKYIRNNDVSKLIILNLGDSVQGILRLSDLKLNQTSVVESTVIVSKLISNLLNNLSTYCYIDYYSVPTSNHSQTRNLGSDRNGLKDEDVEFVIANYINDVLKDNNHINCFNNFGYDYIEFPILNQNAIAVHGHTVKIDSAIKDISFHNRRFYDYLFVAHLHAGKESIDGATNTRDVETLLCPSFIGTCPYSDGLMKASQPSCKVFCFDEVNGHTDTHKIILR